MPAFSTAVYVKANLSVFKTPMHAVSDGEAPDNQERFYFDHWPKENEPERRAAETFTGFLYGRLLMAPTQETVTHLALQACDPQFLSRPGYIAHIAVHDVSQTLTRYLYEERAEDFFIVNGVSVQQTPGGIRRVMLSQREIASQTACDAYLAFLEEERDPESILIGYRIKVRRYLREDIYRIEQQYRKYWEMLSMNGQPSSTKKIIH